LGYAIVSCRQVVESLVVGHAADTVAIDVFSHPFIQPFIAIIFWVWQVRCRGRVIARKLFYAAVRVKPVVSAPVSACVVPSAALTGVCHLIGYVTYCSKASHLLGS